MNQASYSRTNFPPLDKKGFWAFITPTHWKSDLIPGGFVSVVEIGPFHYLRVDFVDGSYLNSFAAHHLKEIPGSEPHTILFPPHALPFIYPATKEEVFKDLPEAKVDP